MQADLYNGHKLVVFAVCLFNWHDKSESYGRIFGLETLLTDYR